VHTGRAGGVSGVAKMFARLKFIDKFVKFMGKML
jgi:hypothetical protein